MCGKKQRKQTHVPTNGTVDGRNPANQLRLVVYPIIYRVLYIPGGAGLLPSTVSSNTLNAQYRKKGVVPFFGNMAVFLRPPQPRYCIIRQLSLSNKPPN